MGTGAAVLLSASFNVAIPALMRHFNIGQNAVQLVVTAFMAANTMAMLASAWLIERYGLRRCFLIAILLLALSIVLGALSPNFVFLLAVRVIQGAVAGILYPMGTIVVMRLFPANEQGRATGFMAFGLILAPAIAPAVGGLMIDNLGWQTVFFMSMPFCAVAGFGALRYLAPAVPDKHADFDWLGMTILSVMTVALLGCTSSLNAGAHSVYPLIFAAALALIALGWFLRHARHSEAIITRKVLWRRPVLMGMAVSFVHGANLYGSSYLIPVFLQTVRGFTATQAGGLVLPSGLVLVTVLPLAGLLVDRVGPRLILLAGLALFGVTCTAMWNCAADLSYAGLVGLTIVGRIGVGLSMVGVSQAALRGLQGRTLGQSVMIISYMRMMGGFLSVALLAAFVEWRGVFLGATPGATSQAFRESFLLLAIVCGLAMVTAWKMRPAVPSCCERQ